MLTTPDIAGHSDDPRGLLAPVQPAARRARLAMLRAQLDLGHGPPACLSLGAAEIHAHLPTPGLAVGVLHEAAGETHGDRPAAFGFLAAIIAMAEGQRPGPALLVTTRHALRQFGRPYEHGLGQLGLDTGRLLLIETRSDKDAQWALEEVLRSEARPAVVAGVIDQSLDLTASRRLNLAAARFGTPLVILSAPGRTGTSAAATRWRIASAHAARDRFGALARCRWRVTLERCRNGRPGEWLIEWDHVAHRFRLASGMADRPPATGAILRRVG